jgi:formate dehydrogenase major subunit
MWIIAQLAKRLGHDWGEPTGESVWNEVRAVAPEMFGGMTYARLEAEHGLQWPCASESEPGAQFLHARLWAEPMTTPRAPFIALDDEPPVEMPDREYPFQLTTGRRLESYNTGVQSGGYDSPLHRGESLDLSPEDAKRLRLKDGEAVRVTSRSGSVVAPARIEPAMRPGLVFMTLHFQDDVRVNLLTIDATDPLSGTAEFKACAVKLEPVRKKSSAKAKPKAKKKKSPTRR